MNITPGSDAAEALAGYTVTFVPEIGRIEVTGPGGQPVGEPGKGSRELVAATAERLAHLSVTYGPEEGMAHLAAADIIDNSKGEIAPAALAASCALLAKVLPREAFNYIGTDETPLAVSLGKIGVASRRPTAEEMPETEGQRIARLDAEKLDLTAYDHARVTVGGREFIIPFESAEARLAARVMEAVRDPGEKNKLPERKSQGRDCRLFGMAVYAIRRACAIY